MPSFPHSDPILWFQQELEKATDLKVKEPNAMQLATVSAEGFPSVRVVYFKGFLRGALAFYTNYESSKGRDLLATKKACVNFFWPEMASQIRIEGAVELASRDESEAYFRTRERLSQIGAWASNQSREIPGTDWLEKRVAEFEAKFEGQEIPCPPHWGGFRLIPLKVEFWFGREGRLHERYLFERVDERSPWREFMESP